MNNFSNYTLNGSAEKYKPQSFLNENSGSKTKSNFKKYPFLNYPEEEKNSNNNSAKIFSPNIFQNQQKNTVSSM